MHGLSANSLVVDHLWIVERFEAQYQQSAPHADLRAAGALGLVEAAQRFEPERGLRFSTYAWNWVKGHVLSELRRAHVVPVPEHTARKACKDGEPVSKVVISFEHQAFLKKSSDYTGERFVASRLMALAAQTSHAPTQESAADRGMRLRALGDAVARLDNKMHRHVMNRTLSGRSIEQIARAMKLSEERVRLWLREAQALLAEELSEEV